MTVRRLSRFPRAKMNKIDSPEEIRDGERECGERERDFCGERRAHATYPEINVQIPRPAEFAIRNLEGDGHLVVLVKLLMETLSRVRAHLDVVGKGEGAEEEEGT